MRFLIPLILLFPSLVLAVDDATIQTIDSKASSANSKADGNNSRIQALEAEDIILHNRIDTIQLTPGPKGDKGDQGIQGIQGIAGKDGINGTNGVDGINGIDGAVGATGPAGADGTNGIDGAVGATGPAGADGTNGIDGAVGATGPAGADGTNGIDGAVGATGPTGADGLDGATGLDGTSCSAIQNVGSATVSCTDGSMASVYDGVDGTFSVDGDNDFIVDGMRPRIIRQIDVQVDTVARVFSQAWGLGKTFDSIGNFKAGSLVRINYHVPMRNDSTSWGGGYIEPQVSFNGGATWSSLGSSGYDGGVMNLQSRAIGSYGNTILIDPHQTSDFSVTVRLYHRSYDGSVTVNGSHDINGRSGTAPLLPGENGLQHYTRVTIEELY